MTYLQMRNPIVKTLEGEKTMYAYFMQVKSLVPKVSYKDQFNVDYKKVTTKFISTYTFTGVPLLDTLLHKMRALPSQQQVNQRAQVSMRSHTNFPHMEELAFIW